MSQTVHAHLRQVCVFADTVDSIQNCAWMKCHNFRCIFCNFQKHLSLIDIFITKTNADASDIAVKSLSGNIKIALPVTLAVQGEIKTSIGEVFSRLSNAEIVSKDNAHHIHREGDVPATVKVSITNGDIFVKDTDK